MDRIRVNNVLQGKVVLRDKNYAISFVTNYGVVTVRMFELDKFLEQNPHLKPIMQSSVIEADQIIGKYINVRDKAAKYFTKANEEIRIRLF
jgi:hypothetical protein